MRKLMVRKTLREVLGPPQQHSDLLRWRVTVPMCTNPFILTELLQFSCSGALVVLLGLCVGARVTNGFLTFEDVIISFQAAAVVLLAVLAFFALICVLFFNNRYFASFQMDSGGVYQEGSKGHDERRDVLCLRMRPYPVVGAIQASRTRSRVMAWEKLDSFQDIASMRVVILRRGFWHMVRLYTPDEEIHRQVTDYLARRLTKR